MTIVLGRRPAAQPSDTQQRRQQWVQHFQDHAATSEAPIAAPTRSIPPGPAPVPIAEIRGAHRGIYASSKRRRCAAPDGVVGLYASRLDAQQARRLNTISTRPAVCTRSIGRGSQHHYDTLYPSKHVRIPAPAISLQMPMSADTMKQRAHGVVAGMRPSAWPKPSFAGFSMRHSYRLANSRRALFASMAALMLMVGMATSTLAAQQLRYEVQEGDTLDTIAAEFGVDPEAIYRSSWMPYGYEVVPGQVIIIPEPGQDPATAAQVAAEREGTSPWAVGTHVIQPGDSFHTIAEAWGVPVDHLITLNPDLDPANLVVGERVIIPWERDTDVVGPQITSEPVVMLSVPNYVQSRNLSCEYAATYAATAAFGPGVGEQTFIDSVPLAANPHNGYRGNIDGWWGNTDDYGVYAEALVPTLNANGYIGESFYSGGDPEILKQHLNAGHPVVVWLGFWGDTRERLDDDGMYSVFAGMHVVTVVGYDDLGVYVMDPAKGVTHHYDWATFTAMWSVVDGMGLAVYPQ